MILAVDGTCIGSRSGGDETAILAMLAGLSSVMADDDRIMMLVASGATLPDNLASLPVLRVERMTRRGGLAHFAAELPRWLLGLQARGIPPDMLLSTTHAPLLSPCPVALILPDLSFRHLPQTYPLTTRVRLRALTGRQARRAAVVLTVSEYSRQDLIASYQLPPDRVHVVPLHVEPPAAPDPTIRAALAARGVQKPFVLYLGNLHPRKNVSAAIAAFRAVRDERPELADLQFVIAGRSWFGSTAEADAAAGAPAGSILFLNWVSNAEREVLLTDAQALVYLSSFEGFGLPPLEAMARGTVVLASNTTSIPEVCGDAALLVEPTQPASIRSGLTRILGDAQLRARLQKDGPVRAAAFHPSATGQALYRALSLTTGQNAPPTTLPI